MVQKKAKETISIIIVNWNTKTYTSSCLKTIYRNCSLHPEIIVVDNHSNDDSCSYLKKRFPKIKLVRNNKNYGYAKANNQGIKLAKNDYILILNPDTQIQKNTIEDLIKFFKNHKDMGAVVPKLINSNATTQYFYHRRLPTLKYLLASFIYNYTTYKNFKTAREYFMLDQKFDRDMQIEQAAGVCILTTKSTIKKIGGLFDENLPIFLNDVDFSLRLRKKHLDIFLVAKSSIVHNRSSSTSKLDPYTLRQEVMLSTLHYLRKNSGFVTYLIGKTLLLFLLMSLLPLTSLGIAKSYLMTPITDKNKSLNLQWKNIQAAFFEKRNHPGLLVTKN